MDSGIFIFLLFLMVVNRKWGILIIFNNYGVKNVDKKHNGKLPNPKESCMIIIYDIPLVSSI